MSWNCVWKNSPANIWPRWTRPPAKRRELRGDIVRLGGKDNLYRLKLAHYRIIFSYSGGEVIVVETIDTRTNIKYRRYR